MQPIIDLAEFVASFRSQDLPEATRRTISTLILDLLGAAVAGRESPIAASATVAAGGALGEGPITIWFTDQTSSVVGAAMANSAAASALDIDDGHRGAAGHAGAGVIPAAFAVAQAVGASAIEVMTAIALGYEVGLRIASSRPIGTIDTVASGRWVNYAVAATAARLLSLDAIQTAHALGIAGSEGPIVIPNPDSKFEGSTVKEGIPPAVMVGINAAYRAAAGATGPLDLLDNPLRFERVRLLGGLGNSWEVHQCYLKPYACCRYMHAAIDAILAMRIPDRPVASLRIETFPQAMRLANEQAPQTLSGAQYSFFYSCALAALHGQNALLPMDPAQLDDRQVLDLASIIELEPSIEFADSFPRSTPARVSIDQGEGVQQMLVLHPLGDVDNPMPTDAVIKKFRRLTTSLGEFEKDELIKHVMSLEHHDANDLFSALAAA